MTGQTLLDTMELLSPELELQSGEVDVTNGLLALNIAQDQLEAILALRPGVLGGQIGTVVTANNTEATAFPSGLLRVDKLQYIDPTTNRPAWDLTPIYEVGGHAPQNTFPYVTSDSPGKPEGYYTDGTNIYWDPLPDGVHTVRYYGFVARSDITAGGTFGYPDICRMPLATLAVKIIHLGLGDKLDDLDAVTSEVFAPTLQALERFRREGSKGFRYTRYHDT